jgi:hypothetical protein
MAEGFEVRESLSIFVKNSEGEGGLTVCVEWICRGEGGRRKEGRKGRDSVNHIISFFPFFSDAGARLTCQSTRVLCLR